MRSNNAMLTLGFMTARRAPLFTMTLVLASWVLSASALDRTGAIDAAKREDWTVRVQFTKRNSPQEEPIPYRGGHAIFIINQSGKVIGRMEGK